MLKKMTNVLIVIFTLFVASYASAHHMAPEELQDFITDILVGVDSPHILSSDEDPSLMGVSPTGFIDADYVVVASGLDATDVMKAIDDIITQLEKEAEVCDYSFTIDLDDDGTYTVTIYVDFCEV